MNDLFEKYKQLLLENENLKIELQKQQTKINLLESELSLIKSPQQENLEQNSQISSLNSKDIINKMQLKISQNEERYRLHLSKINKYVCGLLGFKLNITLDNKVELLSKYAFDESDIFVFTDESNSIDMLSNEFTDEYSKEIEEYIVKGNSVPAFLAAITLDLWSKKTFQ